MLSQVGEEAVVVRIRTRSQRDCAGRHDETDGDPPDDFRHFSCLLSMLSIRRPWPVGQGMYAHHPFPERDVRQTGTSGHKPTAARFSSTIRLRPIRDRATIDSELRLVAAVRGAIRDEGGPMLTTAPLDELLDERLAKPSV